MTAADLQQYIGVIDRMKSLLNSADFDQVFALLTSELPKSKQFLLKMELKRMAQPCNYFIDLRGHVDGDVSPYEFMGKTHYMDKNAIKVFERGLKQYGSYTIGLYEEVLNTENNFRVMHRKEAAQRVKTALQQSSTRKADTDTDTLPEQYAKIIHFGSYTARQDERMNFAIEVEIEYQGRRFDASTSDLSVSGCKVKLTKPVQINPGESIKLFFTGLEQEFMLGLADGVMYKLIENHSKAANHYLRLQRLVSADGDDKQFADFLQRFITGNKRRYKVNLDSVCQTVQTKGYEQFYVPRISALPVFIAVKDGQPIPKFAFTTEYSRSVWHYFLDEQHQAVFDSLLNVRRLKQLLQQTSEVKSTIIYSFTHAAKGKLFFYSATTEELAESEQLKQLFLGFGASKSSWRVFHCNLLRTSAAMAEMPDTIPEQNQSKPAGAHSALVQQLIKDLRYIVNLTDITSTDNTFWYQSYKVDPQQLKQLANFGHKKRADTPPCEAVAAQYVNLRSESRYLYKTAVQIVQPEGDAEINGHSRDFSSKGLQLETTLPVQFEKGDVLLISLPDMQKISSRFELNALPYEIMAISKSRSIMNLRAVEGEQPHNGRLFFQQLIQNNRAKLTPAEESPKYQGLAPALRNMYLNAQNNFALFLHRKGIRYEIDTVAQSTDCHSLQNLLSLSSKNAAQMDLAPILRNNAASLHFAQQLKQMKRFDSARAYELFIALPATIETAPTELLCRYDYEFDTEQLKQQFVLDALQNGSLFCFKLMLSRTGRPDTDYIAAEMNYISTYAIHKAKALEEELWSVAGVIDIVDISTEVPWRYGAKVDPIKQKQIQLDQIALQLKQPVT
ncbi:PilZ domain-containing protein [Rheinheimera maricola]|uniref:PilZ domain-containing protein n=1 Tax=Rheinheimera maricola TaxID=2793282 RepID=A0ABS7XAD4_9GAMM|nr:PilZ domain-containing protein [Rheinheimera maricola]MBZ9612110.1 PilZ domain-containing protein [Rheinheimera maricola]